MLTKSRVQSKFLANQNYCRINLRYIFSFSILAILLWSIVPFCETLYAKTIDYSFDEIVANSDIIITGEVIRVRENLFGRNVSEIKVLSIIDGEMDPSKVLVHFGRKSIFHAKEDKTDFKVGKMYLLFLRKKDTRYYIMGLDSGIFEISSKGQVLLDNKFYDTPELTDHIMNIRNTRNRQLKED